MNIRVSVDARDFAKMSLRMQRQLPFATMLAINNTAEDVKKAVVDHIKNRFTIRKKSTLKDVRFPKSDRATKQKLAATVTLEGPRQKSSIFAKFQRGGSLTAPFDKPFAIPTDEIRPSKASVIPRALYPTNLRLVSRRAINGGVMPAKKHVTRRGVQQIKGKRRTFVIDPAHHRYPHHVVLQRENKTDLRMLWAFRRRISVPRLLDFHGTAKRTVAKVWAPNFNKAWNRAMATAR